MSKENEIKEALEGDKKRLKPAAAAARKQRMRLEREARTLLERGTEDDFIAYLKAVGLRAGSAEFANALKVFRENRS
jgi:hypothetical protein